MSTWSTGIFFNVFAVFTAAAVTVAAAVPVVVASVESLVPVLFA